MMQVLIRSARLEPSPFKMADAEEVFECITPAIARFMRWEPSKSLSEYNVCPVLPNSAADRQEQGYTRCLIPERDWNTHTEVAIF